MGDGGGVGRGGGREHSEDFTGHAELINSLPDVFVFHKGSTTELLQVYA